MDKALTLSLHVRKEALKFSAAHMTVFPDGSKEGLHGHNYSTDLTIGLSSTEIEKMVSFSAFKMALAKICAQWDEKVLLAIQCPFLQWAQSAPEELEFRLCGKRYVLPADEVEKIPVENITCESLAKECLDRLLTALQKDPSFATITFLELRVDESPGQGASCRWESKG